jgi:UDP-N-acetyl-D-mannosaminuronic acid dehydrogenase
MKVCVIGLGYIGLPTSIIAAYYGLDVIGFDIDQQRVSRINQGEPVIEEPEVATRLQKALATKKFRATTNIEPADYFIIAVPTPFHEDKSADLSYVFAAANSITDVIHKGNVIILESTVSIGATEKLAKIIEEKTSLQAGKDFFVAHCPERVLPGKIFEELIHNARIIGGINRESVTKAAVFYKYFVKGPLYLTDAKTAEMVKLIENSSRDVQIAFANQVASMAYELGLNPFEVIELANKHPRVNILNPSCGVGGHCIAVDPWFLIESFPEHTMLLKTARNINDDKPLQVIASVREHIKHWQRNHSKVCTVLALGLTYKPDTDDIRESPALLIAEKLSQYKDIELLVCEPHVTEQEIKNKFSFAPTSLEKGIKQADIIVCLVKHRAFKQLKTYSLSQKVILDICGLLYEPHQENSSIQEKIFWPTDNAYYIMYNNKGHEELA